MRDAHRDNLPSHTEYSTEKRDVMSRCLLTRRWISRQFIIHMSRRIAKAGASARTFHKTVVHDGFLYILGGFDGRRQNDAHRIRTPPQRRAKLEGGLGIASSAILLKQ